MVHLPASGVALTLLTLLGGFCCSVHASAAGSEDSSEAPVLQNKTASSSAYLALIGAGVLLVLFLLLSFAVLIKCSGRMRGISAASLASKSISVASLGSKGKCEAAGARPSAKGQCETSGASPVDLEKAEGASHEQSWHDESAASEINSCPQKEIIDVPSSTLLEHVAMTSDTGKSADSSWAPLAEPEALQGSIPRAEEEADEVQELHEFSCWLHDSALEIISEEKTLTAPSHAESDGVQEFCLSEDVGSSSSSSDHAERTTFKF